MEGGRKNYKYGVKELRTEKEEVSFNSIHPRQSDNHPGEWHAQLHASQLFQFRICGRGEGIKIGQFMRKKAQIAG